MKNTFIIAEAGVNHNGDVDRAHALVEAAAKAGADAVKFQTFSADTLVTRTTPKAEYQKQATGAEASQWEMLRQLELPQAAHQALHDQARELGLEFMSTGFESDSTDFLLKMNLSRYKVPSGELTNAPLVWQLAQSHKPLIVSTGMATLGDIEMALAVIGHSLTHTTPPDTLHDIWLAWQSQKVQEKLKEKVTLLHCTSQYPCPDENINLRAMNTLSDTFGVAVGYSDHSSDILVPVAAVARGAVVIEKHFTLDKKLPGPDHKASLTPEELTVMVAQIRRTEAILGHGRKTPQSDEMSTRNVVRQRVVARVSVKQGELFTVDNITTARSETGVEARYFWDMLGTPASCDLAPMQPVLAGS